MRASKSLQLRSAFLQLRDRQLQFDPVVLQSHGDRVLRGEGDRNVLVLGIVFPQGRAVESFGHVAGQLGQRERPAVEFQPVQHVVDRRFMDLQTGQAIRRGPRPRRVAAQLVLAGQPEPHREPLGGRFRVDHRRTQGKGLQRLRRSAGGIAR